MHETSLVEYAMKAVEERAGQLQIDRIGEMGLVVGRLQAVPEQLELAFWILKQRHPKFADAVLHIDLREVRCRCRDCGSEYEAPDPGRAICPSCGSGNRQITGGNELLVDYFTPLETGTEKGEEKGRDHGTV